MPTYKIQPAGELSLPISLTRDEPLASAAVQDEVLQLFDDCAPALRRYVGSFGLGAEATEDIIQEIFLSLFRHLQLGRSRHNLRGWVFRVGHNLALKQRSRVSKRRLTEGTWCDSVVDGVADPAANPEERLADAQRVRRLRAVLQALPERDRRCVLLRAEGLRYRDIARTLRVSLGSVAKSLTRAVSRLAAADNR
jgi:RNA polymerase sigma-70 factor (ECF subfamily)